MFVDHISIATVSGFHIYVIFLQGIYIYTYKCYNIYKYIYTLYIHTHTYALITLHRLRLGPFGVNMWVKRYQDLIMMGQNSRLRGTYLCLFDMY